MQCIQSLVELDSNLEKGEGEPTLLTERLMLQKKIKGLNRVKSLDFLQKDKIKWAIKGYENSIFFHGIHNKKCKHMAVQGVLVDGEWADYNSLVKLKFLDHFRNRFAKPSNP